MKIILSYITATIILLFLLALPIAAGLLKKYGLPFEVMLPLIDETARKVHELEPRLAQTGPAVRYDENVIGEHLQMLSDEPDMQELYRLISESIHRQNS